MRRTGFGLGVSGLGVWGLGPRNFEGLGLRFLRLGFGV